MEHPNRGVLPNQFLTPLAPVPVMPVLNIKAGTEWNGANNIYNKPIIQGNFAIPVSPVVKQEPGMYRRTYTSRKKLHTCTVCMKKFTQNGNLKRHMLIHTGERPFVCEVCHMKFSQSSHLKSHSRIHTGERPYSCNVCVMKFSRAGNLKNHMRTHTGERPYVCSICCQKFSQASHLKTHTRTHLTRNLKVYSCNVCEAKLVSVEDVKKHMRIHADANTAATLNFPSYYSSS